MTREPSTGLEPVTPSLTILPRAIRWRGGQFALEGSLEPKAVPRWRGPELALDPRRAV